MFDNQDKRGMIGKRLTVFGGSGFIGKNLIQKLASLGFSLRVGVRNPEKTNQLQTMGEVGQVFPIRVDFLKDKEIRSLCENSEAVINLVGTLIRRRKFDFKKANVDIARRIAKACNEVGIEKFVHVSALGADLSSKSNYERSKAEGELAVTEILPYSTILRPSMVLGTDSELLKKLSSIARFSPIMFSFGKGNMKFQPIYVSDVSDAIISVLQNPTTRGKIYELVGPNSLTFDEILMRIPSNHRRTIIHIPFWLGRFFGRVLERLPGQILTYDQVVLLENNQILVPNSSRRKGIESLGIIPKDINFIFSSIFKEI